MKTLVFKKIFTMPKCSKCTCDSMAHTVSYLIPFGTNKIMSKGHTTSGHYQIAPLNIGI